MTTECFHGIYDKQEDCETFEALWHKSVFQPAWVDMQHHVSVSWATHRLYFPYTELKYQWPNVQCGLLTHKLTDSRSLARKATNEKKMLCSLPTLHKELLARHATAVINIRVEEELQTPGKLVSDIDGYPKEGHCFQKC